VISGVVSAMDDREAAIGRGLTVNGERFEVHWWNPPLVYGRRGGPTNESSEGIALLKGYVKSEVIFALITFKLPILTSLAVPQLVNFYRKCLGDVPAWETPDFYLHDDQ